MRCLLLDLGPFKAATRPRKWAFRLAEYGEVHYVSLASVGRIGLAEAPGSTRRNDVLVHHVRNRPLRSSGRLWDNCVNIATSYVPGIAAMAVRVARSHADTVFVENPALLPLGVLHALRFGSTLVYDARERPFSVASPGSLASVVARVERLIYRLCARRTALCIAVSEDHAVAYKAAGFRQVALVRNVPARDATATPSDPVVDELRLAYVGSLYRNRGLEEAIDAVVTASATGVPVSLCVTGDGPAEYVEEIQARLSVATARLDVASRIVLAGSCPAEEVLQRYSESHVALVLYSLRDPGNDSLPNKLFEAMAAGRCVLQAEQREAARVIREVGCGIATDLTVDSLVTAIAELWATRAQITELGLRGARAHVERLNWESETQPVVDHLAMLRANAPARRKQRSLVRRVLAAVTR